MTHVTRTASGSFSENTGALRGMPFASAYMSAMHASRLAALIPCVKRKGLSPPILPRLARTLKGLSCADRRHPFLHHAFPASTSVEHGGKQLLGLRRNHRHDMRGNDCDKIGTASQAKGGFATIQAPRCVTRDD